MKKVYIVSEKNEEKNIYETRTIVIFNEDKSPRVINCESVEDLIPVVEIARENGFDFFNQEEIKKAMNDKFIEVISRDNEKDMSILKAKILEENLKYSLNNVNVVKEEKDVLPKEVKKELTKTIEDGKITRETTMFTPVNGNVSLPIEEREYAEYLKLNSLRNQNRIDKDGLKKISQMAKYNDKVASLESARDKVLEQDAKVKTLSRFNRAEAEKALIELEKLQKEYDDLAFSYRQELSRTIKNFVEEENVVEDNKEVSPVIVREEKEVSPVIVREEKEVSPTIVREEKEVSPTIVREEKEVSPVIVREEKEVSPVIVREEKEVSPTIVREEKESDLTDVKEEIPSEENKNVMLLRSDEPKADNNKNVDDYKPNFILVNDNNEKIAEGINPETNETKRVKISNQNGDDEYIEVKTTNKFSKFLKRVGVFIVDTALLVAGYFGFTKLNSLINKHQNRNNVNQNTEKNIVLSGKEAYVSSPINSTFNPVVNPTSTPSVAPIETATPTVTPIETVTPTVEPVLAIIDLDYEINKYCEEYNVPEETRLFLNQEEVRKFLSRFENVDQLKEAISALCYGYEANILMTKDGNFRMTEDGETYLTSFTRDFLCAKVVVNRYDARQMLNVFGGANISYEEIMQGFQSYTHTVRTYGMNGIEPLPFHYLTNNDYEATKMLNDLQEKLITVNVNRNNHTLTSKHTDDFIEEVFDTFVLNDQSLNISEGAKTVGASLVSSYIFMQAQVSNGEALYLHEDRGLARAGMNLAEVDGHFEFEYPDKTHFEFTSLIDVMNHGYGDVNETAHRCLSEQEQLLASINKMQDLINVNANSAKVNLEVALYREGMNEYAERIQHEFSDKLLDEIVLNNPLLNDVVEEFKTARDNSGKEYLPFNEVVDNIDRLLGIQNRKTNDYATLINNRRDSVMFYNDYDISGDKRYTQNPGNIRGFGGNFNKNGTYSERSETITTTTTEKVSYENLTTEEKHEVDKQVEEMQKKEEEEHKKQEEKVEETVKTLREAVEEGATQEELNKIAQEAGIELDPNYKEEMEKALEEQKQGEEKKVEIEKSVEEHNATEEKASEERRKEEEKRQEEERKQEEELIRQSLEIEQRVPVLEAHHAIVEETNVSQETKENENVNESSEFNSETHTNVIDQIDPNLTTEDEEVYSPVREAISVPVEEISDKEAISVPVEEISEREAISVPVEEISDKEAISVPVEEISDKEAISVPVEEISEGEAISVPVEEISDKEAISVPVEEISDKEAISVPVEETHKEETVSAPTEETHEEEKVSVPTEETHEEEKISVPTEEAHEDEAISVPVEHIDQTDSEYSAEDEEVYIPDDITGRNIETLKQLRALALSIDVDVDELNVLDEKVKTKTLS